MKYSSAIACFIVMLTCVQVKASVVVPVPSVVIIDHKICGKYNAQLTYTATTMDDSILDYLGSFNYFGEFNKTKYMLWSNNNVYTTRHNLLQGGLTNKDKLDNINWAVFKNRNPMPGQQVTETLTVDGDCPYDHGHVICVGTFIALDNPLIHELALGHFPSTFPPNSCIPIPRPPGVCYFELGNSTIDYGVILPGVHHGEVNVPVHCTVPSTVKIKLMAPSDGTTDTVENEKMKSRISIENQPLPVTLKIDQATSLTLSTISTIPKGVTGFVSNSAIIDMSIE